MITEEGDAGSPLSLVIHERLRDSRLLSNLLSSSTASLSNATTLRYVTSGADILITNYSPSLAINFITQSDFDCKSGWDVQRTIELQKKFKSSFSIVIGSEQLFAAVKLSIPLGQMRILSSTSEYEAAALLQLIISTFKDTMKMKKQDEFFKRERENGISSTQGKSIAQTVLKELAKINETDAELLIDAMPTLAKLIVGSRDPSLEKHSPASLDSIRHLQRFFHE